MVRFMVGFSIAAAAVSVPLMASAAPVAGFRAYPNMVRPLLDPYPATNSGQMNQWRFHRDWNQPSQTSGDYALALRFAECVRTFDATVPVRAMSRGLGDRQERSELSQLARQYRGCAPQSAAVSPLLLRAAFAELLLRQTPALAMNADVGVPRRIGSFPVEAIAECQVRAEPGRVAALLRTRPGEAMEEDAARELFRATPQCSAQARGTITPTAARLAIVDAALRKAN